MAWSDLASVVAENVDVGKAAFRAWGLQLEKLLGVEGTAPPVLTAASTVSIAAGTAEFAGVVDITGSTTITRFGIATPGTRRFVRLRSAVTISDSTNLVCPGRVDIAAASGVLLFVVCETSDGTLAGTTWKVYGVLDSIIGGDTPLPPGYLFGLTCENAAGDVTNDLTVNPGYCRATGNLVNLRLLSAMTKRLDANWGAGSGAGGLDTGTKADSTTYHVHLIGPDGGGDADVLFSLSAGSPTLPGGYTRFRRIFSISTISSGALQGFTQRGDRVLLNFPPLSVNTTVGTSRSTHTLSVPTGLSVSAMIRAFASGGGIITLSPTSETDSAPSTTAAPLYTLAAASNSWTESTIDTSSAGQIAARASASSQTLRIATRGWVDSRGRDN